MSKPPQELPTTKEVDTLIAHEMASLSKKDREDALGDLHGVERSPIEDKAFIDKCLVEIEASLTRMKTKTKTKSETKTDSRIDVYSLAESMSKEYVENRAFRLKFLVAEEFKPEDAAERLVRFLELKRNLFGEEKLVQEITLEDFSKEDMRSLETGHVQVLPIHDMCGRSIVFAIRKLRQYHNPESLRRCVFYTFMKAAETSASPRNSVVAVYYCVDATTTDTSKSMDIRKSLPVHFASFHYCYNDETQIRIIQDAIKDLRKASRMRYRPHFGDRQECFATLQSYGIPREAIPVTNDGDFPIEQHRDWLVKQRQAKEDTNTSAMITTNKEDGDSDTHGMMPSVATTVAAPTTITSSAGGSSGSSRRKEISSNGSTTRIHPRENDVLFGRSNFVMKNPGNVKLRDLIHGSQVQYNIASKFEKVCMAAMIVKEISESGRFLRWNGSEWEETSDAVARAKVAHCFRNNRRKRGEK